MERERENRLYPGDVMWDCGVSAGIDTCLWMGGGRAGSKVKLVFFLQIKPMEQTLVHREVCKYTILQ